jgi:hypothetical protein
MLENHRPAFRQGQIYWRVVGMVFGEIFNFGRRKLEYHRVFPVKDMKPVQRIGRDNIDRIIRE